MFPSFLVYVGLIGALIGALSLIKPLRFLTIRSRRAGAVVAGVGLGIAIIGFALPTSEKRAVTRTTELDAVMPVWHFDERHTTHVDASPQQVFDAVREVRAGEILLFRTLTTIRRFGRRGPESILNAPDQLPILEVATRTGFVYLADAPPHELVIGTVVAAPPGTRSSRLTPDFFRAPLPPGFAIAAMNFEVKPDGRSGSLVATETRVFASDRSARRTFSHYWRLIRPGSDIIRRMWLRAIKRRAER